MRCSHASVTQALLTRELRPGGVGCPFGKDTTQRPVEDHEAFRTAARGGSKGRDTGGEVFDGLGHIPVDHGGAVAAAGRELETCLHRGWASTSQAWRPTGSQRSGCRTRGGERSAHLSPPALPVISQVEKGALLQAMLLKANGTTRLPC